MPGIREGLVMKAGGGGGDGGVAVFGGPLQPKAGETARHAEVEAAASAGVGPAQIIHLPKLSYCTQAKHD